MSFRIPLPGDPGSEIAKIPTDVNNILAKILEGKQRGQELADTAKYRQGELGLKQQEQNRLQGEEPLQMDLLRAKIEGEKSLAKWRNSNPGVGTRRGGVGQQAENSFQSYVAKDNPEIADDPNKLYEAVNAIRDGKTTLSDGTPINFSPTAKEALNRVMKSGGYSQQFAQQRFARTTDALLQRGLEYLPSVEKYVGAVGKVNNYSDALKSQYGQESKQYGDYQYLTRQLLPLTAGEMMRALGVNASDEQKKLYLSVVNPVSWDTNFKIASGNYKKLVKLFKDDISPIVGGGLSDTSKSLNQNNNNNSNTSNKNPEKDEKGMVILYKNGEEYHIPPTEMKEALSEGFTLEK